MMSSNRGRLHEEMIVGACRAYQYENGAYIAKIPEPFRVLTKDRARAIAKVRFTGHAQPDFMGVVSGGYGIAFEAKYTNTDKMHQRVVTPTQAAALQSFSDRGGAAGVCIGINDKCFMLPWEVFAHMKEHYGRQYVTAADIAEYRVKTDSVIWFLDYLNGKKFGPSGGAEKKEGSQCEF